MILRRLGAGFPEWGGGLLPALAVLFMSGCLATQKQVDQVTADITQRGAWTDERLEQMSARVEEVRTENQALRSRMDDLSDQLAGLGDDISTRLSELQRGTSTVEEQVREAARKREDLADRTAKDREDMLDRLQVLMEEVLTENEKLRERIDTLENSAYTFGRTHKVQAGESIQTIARLYGVTVDAIIEANGISDANLIHVGEELMIPAAPR